MCNNIVISSVSDESDVQMLSLPVTAATNGMSTISIPVGTVKANPFLPYKEIKTTNHDVPTTTLVEPPTNSDEDAIRVMDTIVSGILYDKYNNISIVRYNYFGLLTGTTFAILLLV